MSRGILTPMLAIAASSPAYASGGMPEDRALSLEVEERGDSVEVQIVANSVREQQVDYAIELVGSSRSRHTGNTTIPAHETQVLSRMKTGFADGWCATLDVTEGDGTRYTVTAGDCAAQV